MRQTGWARRLPACPPPGCAPSSAPPPGHAPLAPAARPATGRANISLLSLANRRQAGLSVMRTAGMSRDHISKATPDTLQGAGCGGRTFAGAADGSGAARCGADATGCAYSRAGAMLARPRHAAAAQREQQTQAPSTRACPRVRCQACAFAELPEQPHGRARLRLPSA